MVVRATLPLLTMLALPQTPRSVPTYPFTVRNWTVDQGLPQNTVNAITQTRDGYLWVGTNGGLARFDGVRFTTFGSGTTPGLPDDHIHSLAEDSAGSLWIATERGVSRYAAGTFQALGAADGLPGEFVDCVYETSDHVLLVGTDHGLARWNGRAFAVVPSVPDRQVTSVVEDGAGRLWVDIYAGPVVVIDLRTYRRRADLERMTRSHHIDTAIGPGPAAGTVWFRGSEGAMLYRMEPPVTLIRQVVTHSFTGQVLTTADGALWIWSSRGILRAGVAPADTQWTPDSSAASPHNLAVDRDGDVWAGTDVRGLIRLRLTDARTLGTAQGLATAPVSAVMSDRSGTVWLGGNCGGLYRVVGNRAVRAGTLPGIATACVWALAQDSIGAIWVGTFAGGVYRFAPDGAERQYGTRDGLPNNVVRALSVGRGDTVWMGTERGLAAFTGGHFRAWGRGEGLASLDIRCVDPESDGTVWLGTSQGLVRFADGRFTRWTVADGLGGDIVRAIWRAPDGALWLTTYGGGLTRFRDGRFARLTRAQGLPDDFLSALIPDGEGGMWVSSNHGFFRLRLDELNQVADGRSALVHAAVYDRADGVAQPEANGVSQESGTRGPGGTYWFATIDGVAEIDPGHEAELQPPIARIEGVRIDGRAVRETDTGAITVPPGWHNLEITYTGLSFATPDRIAFRYRLQPGDRDWTEVGIRRVASYSGLAPGTYRFEVSAANRDGIWGPASQVLSISVTPALWQKVWFQTGLVVLAVALAALLVRNRMSTLSRAHAAQEAFSRQLLESQEQERKRIAGELHDGLGQNLLVMKNRLLLGLRSGGAMLDGPAREHLDIVGKAADEALEGVRLMARNLRPYQLDHVGLAQTVTSSAESVAAAAGLDLHVEVDELSGALSRSDEIGVFRVIQEGLNNVVKHSGARQATLLVIRTPRELRIVLTDDGRGFTVTRTREGRPTGGFGLAGIGERVRMLKGTWAIVSAPGRGTQLTVVIPIGDGGR